MGRKKISYKTDIYASIGADDKFGMVYDGMISSKKFQSLSSGLRLFYLVCRVQAKSKLGTSCLYKHGKEYGITYDEHSFVFPASHMERYGYNRSNGNKYIKDLIKAGFIDKIESNKHMYKVNVYRFSSRWKENG